MNFDLLVSSIEQTHQHFQQQASKAINVSLTLRNWLTGYYIVEFELHGEDRATYGDNLFNELARKLQLIKGIDRRSLYRFKDFYLLYPQIAQYLVDKTENSSSSTIVGSLTPQLRMPKKVGLSTPQSIQPFQVPVEQLLNKLSYTHIEQLLQLSDPLKRAFYEVPQQAWIIICLFRNTCSNFLKRNNSKPLLPTK